MIFIFLPCCEMAHDEEEFSHENSKPHHESLIATRSVKPCIYIHIYIYMYVW